MFRAVPLPIIRRCTLCTGICHTGLKTAFEQGRDGPARKLSSNLYDIYTSVKCAVNEILMMDRGTARNM